MYMFLYSDDKTVLIILQITSIDVEGDRPSYALINKRDPWLN